MINFLFLLAKWLQTFFSIFVFVGSCVLLYRFKSEKAYSRAKKLYFFSIIFLMIYSEFLTILQYCTWYQTDFTRLLLQMPLSSEVQFSAIFNKLAGGPGYFTYYAFTRFWLGSLASIFVSLVIFFVFRFFAKRFSSNYSPIPWFLALGCLVIKWPGFIIFLSFYFALSIICRIAFRFVKYDRLNFELPYALALLFTILFSGILIKIFGLNVLIL